MKFLDLAIEPPLLMIRDYGPALTFRNFVCCYTKTDVSTLHSAR